jgi:Mcm10 replication factor
LLITTNDYKLLVQESCQQCGGSSWVKAGMIAEKKGPKLDSEILSIRQTMKTESALFLAQPIMHRNQGAEEVTIVLLLYISADVYTSVFTSAKI